MKAVTSTLKGNYFIIDRLWNTRMFLRYFDKEIKNQDQLSHILILFSGWLLWGKKSQSKLRIFLPASERSQMCRDLSWIRTKVYFELPGTCITSLWLKKNVKDLRQLQIGFLLFTYNWHRLHSISCSEFILILVF